MAKSRRQRVIDRARGCCEYCQMPDEYDVRTFQVDHIRSKKHRGPTVLSNLCYSCLPCNSYKGSDVSGYDPESGELVPLFNPRAQDWCEHFEWNGPVLTGKSRTGRATITLLRINDADRVAHRRMLMVADVFPPSKA